MKLWRCRIGAAKAISCGW